MLTERTALSYTEALGGAVVPLVRPYERGRSQDVRLQPSVLRGVPQPQDLCRYADPPGHVYHRAQQRTERHTSAVSFTLVHFCFSPYYFTSATSLITNL